MSSLCITQFFFFFKEKENTSTAFLKGKRNGNTRNIKYSIQMTPILLHQLGITVVHLGLKYIKLCDINIFFLT